MKIVCIAFKNYITCQYMVSSSRHPNFYPKFLIPIHVVGELSWVSCHLFIRKSA